MFIDDGSTDGSVAVAERLVAAHPQVSLLELQGNFGKSAALAAGFSARAAASCSRSTPTCRTIPKEIPRFLAKLDEGFDLVSGYKQKRNDPITKVLPSRVFNWLVRSATGVKLHDVNCGFKAYRDVVLKNVRLYGELHRFVPVLAHWKRFRIGEIAVEHHARRFGYSQIRRRSLFPRLDGSAHGRVSCSRYGRRPAHFFGAVGTLTLAIGLVHFRLPVRDLVHGPIDRASPAA